MRNQWVVMGILAGTLFAGDALAAEVVDLGCDQGEGRAHGRAV